MADTLPRTFLSLLTVIIRMACDRDEASLALVVPAQEQVCIIQYRASFPAAQDKERADATDGNEPVLLTLLP